MVKTFPASGAVEPKSPLNRADYASILLYPQGPKIPDGSDKVSPLGCTMMYLWLGETLMTPLMTAASPLLHGLDIWHMLLVALSNFSGTWIPYTQLDFAVN